MRRQAEPPRPGVDGRSLAGVQGSEQVETDLSKEEDWSDSLEETASTTSTSTSKASSTSSSSTEPFDCALEVEKHEVAWSAQKMVWCCDHKQVACSVASTTEITPDTTETTTTTTAVTVNTSATFDCAAEFDNYQAAWSNSKKLWCCLRQSVACDEAEAQVGNLTNVTTGHLHLCESGANCSTMNKSAFVSGRRMCEDHGWTEKECLLVGCCNYVQDVGVCESAVGDRECKPEAKMKMIKEIKKHLLVPGLPLWNGTARAAKAAPNPPDAAEQATPSPPDAAVQATASPPDAAEQDLLNPEVTEADRAAVHHAAQAGIDARNAEAENSLDTSIQASTSTETTETDHKEGEFVALISLNVVLCACACGSCAWMLYHGRASLSSSQTVEEREGAQEEGVQEATEEQQSD